MNDRRTRMGWLEFAGAVSVLAIGAGGLAIVVGLFAFVAALGASGLGALGFVGLAFGLGVLGGGVLVVGLLIRAAVRSIRAGGADAPRPTSVSTAVALGATLVAGGLSVSPAVAAVVVSATEGPSAVLDGSEVVAGLAIALGVAMVTAAWTSRYVPGRTLGVALVAVALVAAAIPAWMTSQIVTTGANRERSRQQAQEHRDRYADLIDGPSVGEIAAQVGTVGSWRPVRGQMVPYVRYDEWLGDQGPIVGLAGKAVRIAVLGQCRVEGAAGLLYVIVHMRSADGHSYRGALPEMHVGPCDGALLTVVTDPIELPAWAPDVLARSRDEELLGVSAGALASDGVQVSGEQAYRWLSFISPDPPTSVEELQAAVAKAAGTFKVLYSE